MSDSQMFVFLLQRKSSDGSSDGLLLLYYCKTQTNTLKISAMKKLLSALLCCCLLGFIVLEPQAINSEPIFVGETTDELPPSYDVIELQGSLVFSPGSNPIEAGVNDNSIYIQFNQNLGNINVTIYNPDGLTVYSGVVNTAVQQLLVIPLSFSTEGTYTIYLENATGYADGDFEKQP